MAVSSALGGAVRRREDPRLITGAGVYTDDVRLDRCLHAVFVRSSMAHARLKSVDVTLAAAMPGVVGIFAAGDLEFASATARPQLASDIVLFVGDAIAVAVADTRDLAVDAAAAVIIDYDPLPVVVDGVKALEPNADLVQADREDNLIVDFELGEPCALDGAVVCIKARFINQRLAAVPIEANAVVVEPDGTGGIRVWASTQVPFGVRSQVADSLGLPEE